MNLNELSKKELIIKCKDLKIKKYSSKNKQQLIELINNEETNNKETNNKETNNEETNNEETNNEETNNKETKICKPILKWAGGKTQIIHDIIKIFPKTINNYH